MADEKDDLDGIPLPDGVTEEMSQRAQQMTAAVITEWDAVLAEIEALHRFGVMLQGSRYFGARNTDGILKAVTEQYKTEGNAVTPQMNTVMIVGTLIVAQQLASEIAWLKTLIEAGEKLAKRARALANEMEPMRSPEAFIAHLKSSPSALQ